MLNKQQKTEQVEIGKKHQASFRIIVAEKRSKLQGRYVEDLGWWNPHVDKFEIKKERADYWIKTGAQPTDSVFNLLVSAEVIAGPKKPVHKKSKNRKIQKPNPVRSGHSRITARKLREHL